MRRENHGVGRRASERRRVEFIGIEILDVCGECPPIARRELGLPELPDNLSLRQIEPGEDLKALANSTSSYDAEALATEQIVLLMATPG